MRSGARRENNNLGERERIFWLAKSRNWHHRFQQKTANEKRHRRLHPYILDPRFLASEDIPMREFTIRRGHRVTDLLQDSKWICPRPPTVMHLYVLYHNFVQMQGATSVVNIILDHIHKRGTITGQVKFQRWMILWNQATWLRQHLSFVYGMNPKPSNQKQTWRIGSKPR